VTRRRRALLLLGLALALGGLAAIDVSRRERALETQLGPLTEVVVARHQLDAGAAIKLEDLGLRRLPARYAPPGAPAFAGELAGHRLAVPVPAGGAVTPDLLAHAPPPATIAKGERALELLASGSVTPGARVDVVVTGKQQARLALENVEVLAARQTTEDGKPRVAATLRVTPAQAVYLTAAQSFASDIRLLVRAPGDRRKVGALAVDDGL
jgi:pilus assembly protein CpaB